jgi:hypothetical protein
MRFVNKLRDVAGSSKMQCHTNQPTHGISRETKTQMQQMHPWQQMNKTVAGTSCSSA